MNTVKIEARITLTKTHLLLLALFLASSVLSACGTQTTQEAWTTFQAASDTLVNPSFPAYSFEYPSYWRLREDPNHITFASEAKILESMPKKLQPGQIVGGLTIDQDMSPQEMVEGYTSSLGSRIQFEETVSVRLNGRAAVYRTGSDSETGDTSFVLAVDMGKEIRGRLSARMAAGELEKWEEILFKMAGSLQVEK